MNEIERDEFDGRIDESLRAVGSRLTDARASDALCERVRAALTNEPARAASSQDAAALTARVRRMGWALTTLGAVAAALALSTVFLWTDAQQQRQRADEWALKAKGLEPGRTRVAGYPAESGERPLYAVVTLYHNLCPRSAKTEPLFERLPEEFDRSAAMFIVLDVSKESINASQEVCDRFGMDLIGLFKEKGAKFAETGMVKVVDLRTGEVVYTMNFPDQFGGVETFLQDALASK